MPLLVVDASAILEMSVRTPLGLRCAARILRNGHSLHAPALLDIEFLQALDGLVRRGAVNSLQAIEAREVFGSLPLRLRDHALLRERIWRLRDCMSARDAAYVALAEGLDAPLVTCDAALAASRGHAADIALVQ
jgi:predicted nucleic acid-binding protein